MWFAGMARLHIAVAVRHSFKKLIDHTINQAVLHDFCSRNHGGIVRQAHVLKCFVLLKEYRSRLQHAVVGRIYQARKISRRTPGLVRGTRKTACS